MVIIVGSGAGGAILAMELAKSNVPVTIIEKGKYIDSKDAFNYYEQLDENLLINGSKVSKGIAQGYDSYSYYTAVMKMMYDLVPNTKQ